MIDPATLPLPLVVEPLDFESIYQAQLADFTALMGSEWTAALESDPVVKMLECNSYREMLLRARINDAARAVMPAFAVGSDLDNIAARFGVTRLVITPSDPTASPPVAEVLEGDARLRQRYFLALDGRTTAGPSSMYKYLALTASPLVNAVQVVGPALTWTDGVPGTSNGVPPGQVNVYIQSTAGNGTLGVPDSTLLNVVTAYLNGITVRPLCDTVNVLPVTLVNVAIAATIYVYPGASSIEIMAQANAAATAYQTGLGIGDDVCRSAIIGNLWVPGVESIVVTLPSADVIMGMGQIANITGFTLTPGGVRV